MKHHQIGLGFALGIALGVAAPGLAQQAVQWRVEDGGNGHWYRLITVPNGLTWESAKELCVQAGGHLATITSNGEQELLATLTSSIPGHGASPVRGWGPWIGGYQQAGDGEPASGWRWVTGESWNLVRWSNGQPDNLCTETGQVENFLSIHNFLGQTWNDLPPNGCDGDPVVAYWIEFSADCNGDGIVDYGQCRDGSLPDYDGDNIPDCCEASTPCIVSNYPVQWRVEDGGNGHWYERIPVSTAQNFDANRLLATSLGGDLASITSDAENAFVRVVAVPFAWESGVLIGTRTPPGCAGFNWTDGEPWVFTAWGYNQPDCKVGDGVGLYPDGWHDLFDWHVVAVVAEWSADCNGDGIVDYGQILQGQLVDADSNGVPDICEADPCPGDINESGVVNGIDLAAILAYWGTDGGKFPRTDANGDGTVDANDLAIVLSGWGDCPN